MNLTQITPAPIRSIDVESPDLDGFIEQAYRNDREVSLRLNMITSLTGAAVGGDGTSDSLTHAVDRKILRVIRGGADVVLVGAESVRAEGYVVPRTSRLAIVTATGRLQGHRLRLDGGEKDAPIIVLCPQSRIDDVRNNVTLPHVDIVGIAGADQVNAEGLVDALRDRGLNRIVCEGGPTLASQLAVAGLIDEYCVSVSPALHPVTTPFLRVDSAHMPHTRVRGHLVDDAGFSYLRLAPSA